ncbi:MAG: hypothetical protein M5U01_02790 [Ardenticatenaceae bacterium]|nr:hypothetical protein [Ardenticatenaceae bacterium]
MDCFLCLSRHPNEVAPANAECSNCARYVCYDHAIRVQQGEFLCLECYETNEAFYKEQRRLIQKPRYNVPRPPGERVNTSYEDNEKAPAAVPAAKPVRRGLLARLLHR